MTATEQYLNYLNSPRKQYNGIVEKPARESTIEKLTKVVNTHNDENKAKFMVENALANNRRVLCWSDHHFNHDMLWKKGYRDFQNREDMNNQMIKSLMTIKPEDLVIFGGDLCFYDFKEVLEKINQINCEKIFVVGNHDVRDNALIKALSKSFDAIVIAFEFKKPLSNESIIVSHYPISNEFLLQNQKNLHGHTHQYLMGKNHMNMCVEHTEYGLKEFYSFF